MRASNFLVSALAAAGLASASCKSSNCKATNGVAFGCPPVDKAYVRDAFFLGGRTVALSDGNYTVDQLFVEKLTPVKGVTRPKPLVFLHGGGISGATWLNTPDGRQGWASYFVDQGFQVYLVDIVAVGRSANADTTTFSMTPGTSIEILEQGFTAVERFNTYPQSQLHTQWPGAGVDGDAVFDQFKQGFLPLPSNATAQELAFRASGCRFLALVGRPAYLVSHSMGSAAALLLTNDCPERVAASINLEPFTVPFFFYGWGLGGFPARPYGLTNSRLDYVPPVASAAELRIESVGTETLAKRNCYRQVEPARQLPKVASVPYVALTGEASVHITYDHCIIDYLKQVGGQPEWIKLEDLGIKGNGHFLHQERNSEEIADVVLEWINKADGKAKAKAKAKATRSGLEQRGL
ncbi:hypothetical protein VD0002_g7182 [Verticillium dahliae]|uniref:AB hydrolase-1 domain-containing protein n=1 Tax=Verticillium dahliae TaxID=27337 RepID=A0AA44WI74_VERDA|nr:hypothetical protein BJF96_g5219 [Verticillium dahliae]PNH48974.1 hypothetical protein VD0003_g8162 [Verticillium dahliae]PNH60444.1 hypothetical protein VD0002_g7182 [Verticillium dahliae]